MIKIGLVGTESMHAWAFAEACNVKHNGEYLYKDARVTAVWGLDDKEEHIKTTMEKGNVDLAVNSLEELEKNCNAVMILQRKGTEHLKYAEYFIKKGYPVFIDKPVCCSREDIIKLKELAKEYDAVIAGGSGLKANKQVREIKKLVEENYFENIRGGTINHSADMECPYNGIFFYLPHAVEMMLEMFGYNPVSVNATMLSNNNFTVCVKYENFIINLAINSCNPSYITVNGTKSISVEVDASDIFKNEVGVFINKIENNEILKDTDELTKHVEVIIAVCESLKNKKEVMI